MQLESGYNDVEACDSPAAKSPRPRVLLIAYVFPPVGGAGVQRVTKFVKYLPTCGWDVSVLTVANPSVPLQDTSLNQDIPPETKIYRARTWEPGYGLKSAVVAPSRPGNQRTLLGRGKRWLASLGRSAANTLLQPDPQVLWRPRALAEGLRILRAERHDVILASGPPFSSLLLAAALARRSGLPFVLDYRDEWDLSNQYWESKRLGPWSLAVQKGMQNSVLRHARAVVATTEASADSLREHCRQANGKARVACIYNGFDRDDFTELVTRRTKGARASEANSETVAESGQAIREVCERPPHATGTFRLTYVGTLWTLTTMAPVAQAIRVMLDQFPEGARSFRLVAAGRKVADEQRMVDQLGQETGVVEEHPYVSHREAVQLMGEASELLVLLSDLPGVGRVLPAKVFEYLATGIPILAVAPRGELWRVLENFPHVRLFEPCQTVEIAGYLERRIRGEMLPPVNVREQVWESGYDRQAQAGQLARLLEEVTKPVAEVESVEKGVR
jgi:glycosyltransferase involved in cell wall biosynthesis